MNTTLKKWKPGGTLQSTHRADYKPYTEAYLPMYQFRCQAQRKPTPPSYATRPPQIDEDTWAKSRRYCYRTTNSIYGSSCFTQNGKSLMVSVLERDRKPVPPKAKEDQGTPAAGDEKPSATPPQALCQETLVPPVEDSKLTTGSATTATSTSQTSSSATTTSDDSTASPSSAPASGPGTDTSSAKQSDGCSPGIKTTLKSDTGVEKEALPVASDTAKTSDKLPQIGSGEGGSVQAPQKREAEKPKPIVSYEEFLQNMCNSVRRERLLNQRCASQTTAVLRGVHPQYSTSYKGSFHKLPQDERPFRGIASRLPNPDMRQRRLCFVSEYADKFGLLQRTFPPRPCRKFTPVAVARPQVAIQPTPAPAPAPPQPPRRTMCSEYMASYCHPSTMSRPKTR